jgi:hypothetical protein
MMTVPKHHKKDVQQQYRGAIMKRLSFHILALTSWVAFASQAAELPKPNTIKLDDIKQLAQQELQINIAQTNRMLMAQKTQLLVKIEANNDNQKTTLALVKSDNNTIAD